MNSAIFGPGSDEKFKAILNNESLSEQVKRVLSHSSIVRQYHHVGPDNHSHTATTQGPLRAARCAFVPEQKNETDRLFGQNIHDAVNIISNYLNRKRKR